LKQTMKGAKLGTEGFFFISKIDSIESQFWNLFRDLTKMIQNPIHNFRGDSEWVWQQVQKRLTVQ
jgi:hypothetical protein